MRPPNDAEIAAREQLCREGEAALAAREARLLALERELGIGEAIEAQPPISEVAGGPRGDHPRDVIPGPVLGLFWRLGAQGVIIHVV